MNPDTNTPNEMPAGEIPPTASKAALHEAVDKAAASMGHAALSTLPAIEGAAKSVHNGVDYLAEAVAPSAQWVKEHPLQALGLAFATGYLVGRLGR